MGLGSVRSLQSTSTSQRGSLGLGEASSHGPALSPTPGEPREPPVESPARRDLVHSELLPTAIFIVVTLCIFADFVDDLERGQSALHLAGALGSVLSMTGAILMLRLNRASRLQARELATALDHTRSDCVRWHEQAAQMLKGLGALIDRQFAEWGLSPAEREVGLLLLKGLSLKDIAAARGASEPTVRQHAHAIYRKAGLAGRAELSAFFLEDLLLPRDATVALAPPSPSADGRGR